MVLNDRHSREIYILRRRVYFLELLDALSKRDADVDEFEAVARQFQNVETLQDVIKSIQDIYKD